MYFDLPEGLKIEKVKLQLCKNDLNRTVVGNIKEAFNVRNKLSLGNINELSFCVHFKVNYRNTNKRNKNENELRERRIIKATRGNQVEYYIIHKITKVYEKDQQYKQVECFSLGYELHDKIISNLSLVSKNATQQLNTVLALTNWTVGYVDSQFDIIYRGLEVTSSTVLDAIIQIAQTFNALIVYDTVNRTISFYDFESYGQYKGGVVKKGKLLKNITYESDSSEYCTRLEVYGKDDISINSVNPTGTNYIEDYSSILRGFQRNPDKSVISSAPDISDSLANALLDYQELVESKQGEFQDLLEDLNEKTEDLIIAEGELIDLQSELAVIEDNISTANASGNDPSSYIIQKNNKLIQISNKTSQINTIKNQIDLIKNDITQLKNLLDVNNNFTEQQLREWNNHIVVKEFRNEYIDEPAQLLEAAKMEMEKMREPKIVVNIGIVNLFQVLSEYKNWNKMRLGDIFKIDVEDIGVKIKAKILEMDFDEEKGDINLTIGNIREILNDEERFVRDLYKTISTSTTFDVNKYKFLDSASKANEVYQTINNIWDANNRQIVASNNETVEISRRGIRTYDLNDPMRVSIMQHGIIAISNDGGNTWKNAITPDGVVAERLLGVITATNDLTIQNQAGTVAINANGFNVTDMNLSLVTSNNKSRININPTSGIQIQKNTGTAGSPIWVNQISLDSDGNAVFGGNITIGSGNSVFKADSNGIYLGHNTFSSAPFRVDVSGNLWANSATLSNSVFNNGQIVGSSINIGSGAFTVNSAGAVVASNITITGGSINWSNVSKPTYGAWEVGAIPNTYIDSNGIWTGYLNASRIIAGQITADYINTTNLAAEKLYRAGTPNNYIKVGGIYSDLELYYNGSKLFTIENALGDGVVFRAGSSQSASLSMGGSGTSVYGIWDFSNATVYGIYARFA